MRFSSIDLGEIDFSDKTFRVLSADLNGFKKAYDFTADKKN